MVTRAVHFEVLQSLSTNDFLIAFRTFCNMRGQPAYLYSDNAKNFEGAERLMRPSIQELNKSKVLQEALNMKRITWKFQPPEAPHFGGVHESLIKSAKRALYKMMTLEQRKRKTLK